MRLKTTYYLMSYYKGDPGDILVCENNEIVEETATDSAETIQLAPQLVSSKGIGLFTKEMIDEFDPIYSVSI